MHDSEFIQDWPRDKLTVAQLRAITEVVCGCCAEGSVSDDLTTAAKKLKAALGQAEDSECTCHREPHPEIAGSPVEVFRLPDCPFHGDPAFFEK